MTCRQPLRARTTVVALACAMAMAVLLAALAPAASAGAIDPAGSSIANSAELGARGTTLQLHGLVQCGACKGFTLGATVSQAGTGAIGQGGVRCICHGARERWLLTAHAREATAFRTGAARVCVWLTARGASGKAIDARQWCESVRLTAAGV
jgi:hypothetical protein